MKDEVYASGIIPNNYLYSEREIEFKWSCI